MHLGYQVYVLGQTTTPSLRKGDLLIAFSGSGSTSNVSLMAAKVKKIGGHIVAVTTKPESHLGKMADVLIEIKASAKQDITNQNSQQFSGSLFEQSSLLLFEAIFHVLSQDLHKSAETWWALHTNIE
jgi:6-phospho-3-hexuloisomerase